MRKQTQESVLSFKRKYKYEEEGRSIVYVDESGFAHDMPRIHGYSPIGLKTGMQRGGRM